MNVHYLMMLILLDTVALENQTSYIKFFMMDNEIKNIFVLLCSCFTLVQTINGKIKTF